MNRTIWWTKNTTLSNYAKPFLCCIFLHHTLRKRTSRQGVVSTRNKWNSIIFNLSESPLATVKFNAKLQVPFVSGRRGCLWASQSDFFQIKMILKYLLKFFKFPFKAKIKQNQHTQRSCKPDFQNRDFESLCLDLWQILTPPTIWFSSRNELRRLIVSLLAI